MGMRGRKFPPTVLGNRQPQCPQPPALVAPFALELHALGILQRQIPLEGIGILFQIALIWNTNDAGKQSLTHLTKSPLYCSPITVCARQPQAQNAVHSPP